MLKLYYDLALGERVPEKVGFKAPAVKFAFSDYVEAALTVYASGVTPLDLSSVASWRGCVDVDTDADTEPLVRILPGAFDATDAATGKLGFAIDCNTTNFRDRIKTATIGFLELYGHDADDRQIVRIRIPATMLLPGDPPGDPSPLDVPPSSVRTLNGQPGAVVIESSAGAALPAANGKIRLDKAAVGLSNVQNILDNLTATAAPTATDDSSKGYSKGSRWIYAGKLYTCVDATVNAAIWTEGGGGAGGGDGLHCDDNPLDAYQAYDATIRAYTWLDGTAASPKLAFKNYLQNLQEVTFFAKSENAESSGDAMLVAKRPDGTEVARFTVAVTPTAALRTLSFSSFTGALEITRDTTDALDTLPGAIKIYALSTWRAK